MQSVLAKVEGAWNVVIMSPFSSHLEFSHFVRTMRSKGEAAVFIVKGVRPYLGYCAKQPATILELQGASVEQSAP